MIDTIMEAHDIDQFDYGVLSDDFVSSFQDWIVKFGETKESVVSSVGEDHAKAKDLFDVRITQGTSGCIRIPIDIQKLAKDSSTQTWVGTFLVNFRTLWTKLDNDATDELSKHAPLFKLFVAVLCHKRTAQITIGLALYYLALLITVDIIYPVFPVSYRIVSYFTTALQVAVYCTLLVLFNGEIFHEENPYSTSDAAKSKDISSAAKPAAATKFVSTRPAISLNCFHYLKESIFKSSREARQLFELPFHNISDPDGSSSEVESRVPFYKSLSIAIKFLIKFNRCEGDDLNLNLDSVRHNWKLVWIFFCVPLYCVLFDYAAPIGPVREAFALCAVTGPNDPICINVKIVFLCSLCYVIPCILKMIFMSTVLMSLVALSVGADVARGLVDHWIVRFGCLRCVSAHVTPTPATNSTSRGSGTHSAATLRRHSNKYDVANLRLSQQVNKRFNSFGKHLSSEEAVPLIQRDAYEQYLFIREFMSNASVAWSFTIIFLVALAVYFTVLFLYAGLTNIAVISNVQWAYYTCWILIRIFLLMSYPIISLAHANVYVYALEEQFLVTAPEDFAVLGGRDVWLEYLQKVPAMWTVYGFTVSWDRLSALLWASVAGLVALALGSLFNNS